MATPMAYQLPDVVTVMTMDVGTTNDTDVPPHPPHYVDVLKLANQIVLTAVLVFIMIGMGCVISVQDIKTTAGIKYIPRPRFGSSAFIRLFIVTAAFDCGLLKLIPGQSPKDTRILYRSVDAPCVDNSIPDRDCDRNIVYIKVHKAASSLMNQILLRYGINKNKTLALPQRAHYFDFKKHFKRNMVYDYRPNSTYQMLINHARYNRPEMNAVVPNALYFATVRDPVPQFESAFGFYEVSKQIANEQYPTTKTMQKFISDPKRYLKKVHYGDFCMWNCQIFDFGLDSKSFNNKIAVYQKILRLEEQFDFVLITEFIDESLILLKNMLCLNFTDILYLPSNVRSNKFRSEIPKNLSARIRTRNSADVALYDHFKRTLWKRIHQQGPNFWKDLKTFRELQEETFKKCVNYSDPEVDKRTWNLRLKSDAQPFCKALTRNTVGFVNNFREQIMNNTKAKQENKVYSLGHFETSEGYVAPGCTAQAQNCSAKH